MESDRTQELDCFLRESGSGPNLAFPDNEHGPSERAEFVLDLGVAGGVALQFRKPVFTVGFGQAGNRAGRVGVLMPETAMYEDHLAAGGKYKIWLPGQVPLVKAVPVAQGMQQAPHSHFGFHAG